MKVLLCSPYESEIKNNVGGIAVWTKNVIDYYRQHKNEVDIEVLPYNRSIYVHEGLGKFRRLFYGVKDYLNLLFRTRRRLKEGQFDVVHLSSSALWSIVRDYIVMRMAHHYGVAGVIHFHCGRIPGLKDSNSWRWRILKRVVSLASATIVLDDASFMTLSSQGYQHVYKVPNPLSEEICQTISNLSTSISRIPRRMLFVGHVLPSKGVYELVRSCVSIPDIKVCLLGRVESKVESELLSIAQEKQGDWLQLLGEKSHSDVLCEMLACDLFVFPSYTEGFPNVILEAMACGCPIIATSVGAIPEMLSQQSGILIPPKNIDAIRLAILELIDNVSYKSMLSEHAVSRVRDEYFISAVWQQLRQIWNQCTEEAE